MRRCPAPRRQDCHTILTFRPSGAGPLKAQTPGPAGCRSCYSAPSALPSVLGHRPAHSSPPACPHCLADSPLLLQAVRVLNLHLLSLTCSSFLSPPAKHTSVLERKPAVHLAPNPVAPRRRGHCSNRGNHLDLLRLAILLVAVRLAP